ncbi:MAG: hypothetical protein K2H93_04665, partial [Oscillospiraceae bacterium]|nr:hypothetical protein [Oscillospiraceae bacterium]
MIKKMVKFILSFISLLLIIYGLSLVFFPIRRSEEAIHKYLLKKIELGINYDDAINIINNR